MTTQYPDPYSYPQPYQVPQYTRQRNNRPILIAVLVSLIVVIAAAVVVIIVLANKSGTISTSTIQSSMESTMSEKGITGTIEALECPTMTAEKGATYTCIVTIDGQDAPVQVTVQDDDGSIYWRMNP